MVEPVTLTTVEYSGGHVYRNGRLERVGNSYGYWADSTFHYHITDYQGNIRAVIAGDGTLEEVNNYYPYGGLMGAAGTIGVQPHKYGAKELDCENGLDLYDSHARWYDPLLARTTTQDPLAEKYCNLSPYAWCAANPMKYIDPNGMDNYQVDSLGNISLLQKNNENSDRIFSLMNDGTNYIDVNKSLMSSEKTEFVMLHSPTYGDGKVKVSTYRSADALQVYCFMKEHTLVEWTLINNAYLGTSHDRDRDVTASYLLNKIENSEDEIFEMRHIHPGGGKTVSKGDISVAKDIQALYPSARLFIDIPSKYGGTLEREYDQYDMAGVLEEVFCIGKKIKK